MRNSSERWVKIGSTIRITNFRSCKDVEQYINSLLTENPLLLEPKTRSMIDYKAIEPSITLEYHGILKTVTLHIVTKH